MASLPQKEMYCVTEIVPHLSGAMGITEAAARLRIYRAIVNGDIQARTFFGSIRIPREEVMRIIEGEPI